MDRSKQQFGSRREFRFTVVIVFLSWFFPLLFLSLAMVPAFSPFLLGEDAESAQPLLRSFVEFCLAHWSLVLLSLGFIALYSFVLGQMIFGPMRRFEMVLLQKKANPTEPVQCTLRRTDYFQRFSHLLEDVLNGLTETVEGPVPDQGEKDMAKKTTSTASESR